MATIHIARGGTSLGTFSVDEVREGLRIGQFYPPDLGWGEGIPDWRRRAQMIAEKPAPLIPPIGAAGASQPELSSPPSGSDGSLAGRGLPWEHREQLGILKGFFDTVALIFTNPAKAFALMKSEGDVISPLFFAVIGGTAAAIVSVLSEFALRPIGLTRSQNPRQHGFGAGVGLVFWMILAPVMFTIWTFVWSGILHLCLMLVGGARKPFETTFRVVCFASGSTSLLAMVPICGGLVACVWTVVLECIGLARAHETDTGKAVTAVLLPVIVCCGGIILIVVL